LGRPRQLGKRELLQCLVDRLAQRRRQFHGLKLPPCGHFGVRQPITLHPNFATRRPMHDLKAIRDDPDAFDAGLRRRGLPPQAGAILALDQERRRLQQSLEEMQARRNSLSKEIGRLKAKGEDQAAAAAAAEVAGLKESLPAAEQAEREKGAAIESLLATIPNLPASGVPEGPDESANVEIRRQGDPQQVPAARLNKKREHFELGESLGLMDFQTAAKLAGARFVVLKRGLARLERAL